MADDPTPVSIAFGQVAVSTTHRFPVDSTTSIPVGGGLTWTKSAATMTGSSAVLLAANAARKGVIVSNAAANAQAAFDPTGGTAALTAGIPLSPGQTFWLIGSDCPVGGMTQIGTNTQVLTVYEGF